ncbi:TetR/AcrR family transcriptional regulator [Actinomycetospora straminea]|uniref:HTH tetR-type domain-containing protein n=1 Tax=Actinomycetospora straminea TaxID=663607 RepID=A0ABP9E0Z9_9PSEU|nr:TetR/AcrR family transcriptional regulator [Actinomycetospora straminea]MDD7934151.1 helix-turn-helix domain containing protein [Actinomycetospora straminea]
MTQGCEPAARTAGPPLGRRAATKARTREALLDAARRVFAERGYGPASVEEIARTAGVSVGSVYVHFASKDALFTALVETQTSADVDTRASLVRDDPQETFDALDRLVGEVADSREEALLDAEIWLYAVRHPEFVGRLAEHEVRLARFASEQLSPNWEGVDPAVRATVRDDEFIVAAAALYHGLIRLRRVLGEDAVPADLYSRVLRLVLRLPEQSGE